MHTLATPPVLPARADDQAVAQSRAIRAAWKAYIGHHHASASQHATYALLRGKSLDKTFTPLRRPSKIQGQGGIVDRARRQAEASARSLQVHAWAPFAGLLEDAKASYGRYVDGASHPLLRRVMA